MRGLIVEGIDRSGKSTLIAEMKHRLKATGGCDVVELDHVACVDQFLRYLGEYAMSGRRLFHRAHLSEHVYGKMLRGRSPFAEREFRILNDVARTRFIIVLAEPGLESFTTRLSKAQPPETVEVSQYEAITSGFRDALDGVEHLVYRSSSHEELNALATELASKLSEP